MSQRIYRVIVLAMFSIYYTDASDTANLESRDLLCIQVQACTNMLAAGLVLKELGSVLQFLENFTHVADKSWPTSALDGINLSMYAAYQISDEYYSENNNVRNDVLAQHYLNKAYELGQRLGLSEEEVAGHVSQVASSLVESC